MRDNDFKVVGKPIEYFPGVNGVTEAILDCCLISSERSLFVFWGFRYQQDREYKYQNKTVYKIE